MTTQNEVIRALRDFAHASVFLGWRKMLTGRRTDTNTITMAGAPAGKTWVRAHDASREQTAVWGFVGIPNVTIWVAPGVDGENRIMAIDYAESVQSHGDKVLLAQQPPLDGNLNTVLISGQNFQPGRLRAYAESGSMLVYVEPLAHRDGYYAGGTIDLTGDVPTTSGTNAWVAVALDPATGTLYAYQGSETYDSISNLDVDDAHAISVPDTYLKLGAVALNSDTTEITPGTRIIDLRSYLSAVGYPALDSLGNVDTSSTPPTDGQALVWNDSSNLWVPGSSGGGGGGAAAFGAGVIKTLSSDVAAAGTDRHLILAAESGTADDCIEITGLSNGDEVIVRADAGDTITLKHNAAGATDKILLYAGADFALSGDKTMKLVKTASGKVVQYVDEQGSGGGGGSGTLLWDKTLTSAAIFDTNDADDHGNSGAFSGSYWRFEILFDIRASAMTAVNVSIAFNNDTTNTNYQQSYDVKGNSDIQGLANNSRNITSAPGSDATANYFTQAVVRIYNPNSAHFKSAIGSAADARSSAHMNRSDNVVLWRSTASITRIAIAAVNATTTFVAGSRMTVMGY